MNWKKLAKKYKKNYTHDIFARGRESYSIWGGAVKLYCDINEYGKFYNVVTNDGIHEFSNFKEASIFFEKECKNELS